MRLWIFALPHPIQLLTQSALRLQACTADAMPTAAAGGEGSLLAQLLELCCSAASLEAGDAGAGLVLAAALGTLEARLMGSVGKAEQQRLLVALLPLASNSESDASREAVSHKEPVETLVEF